MPMPTKRIIEEKGEKHSKVAPSEWSWGWRWKRHSTYYFHSLHVSMFTYTTYQHIHKFYPPSWRPHALASWFRSRPRPLLLLVSFWITYLFTRNYVLVGHSLFVVRVSFLMAMAYSALVKSASFWFCATVSFSMAVVLMIDDSSGAVAPHHNTDYIRVCGQRPWPDELMLLQNELVSRRTHCFISSPGLLIWWFTSKTKTKHLIFMR